MGRVGLLGILAPYGGRLLRQLTAPRAALRAGRAGLSLPRAAPVPGIICPNSQRPAKHPLTRPQAPNY